MSCVSKDTIFTSGVKNEINIESEVIWNSTFSGKRRKMFTLFNICRYDICQETVTVRSLYVHRCCVGEVE